MTLTIKSEKVNRHYITIESFTWRSGYKVSAYPMIDEDRCGYPVSENYYGERKQAMHQFYCLKKRFKE